MDNIMKDDEIIRAVKLIRRLQRGSLTGIKRAIIEGLTLRLEDHGVTESDLDRLELP